MTAPFRIWPAAVLASMLATSLAQPGAFAADGDDAASALEQAKQHFARGVAFYKDGDLDAALAEFDKAYETRADYRVLYNIGQVQAERHDNAAAMKVLRQYLTDGGSAIDNERRTAVEQTLRDMSKRVGSVSVTANVADAEVLVDGVSVAVLPLVEPLSVNAGIREITVRKAGQTATPRRITIAGGDTLRLELRLEPDTGREALAPVTAMPGTPAPAPASPAAAPSAIPTRPRVWIAYGAAVALGAGATTFALLARSANKDLDADLGQFPGDRAKTDHDRTRLKTWAGMTDGFAAAALIAAGLGTYFLLSGQPGGESAASSSRSAQLSLLPSGAALSLSGSF